MTLDHGLVSEPCELPLGTPYLAMELGRASLREASLAAWPRLRRVLLHVLDGLAHAHARGVLHRDIKPGNILDFSSGGREVWKLTDFGISTALGGAPAPEASRVQGTPADMAPEQIEGLASGLLMGCSGRMLGLAGPCCWTSGAESSRCADPAPATRRVHYSRAVSW